MPRAAWLWRHAGMAGVIALLTLSLAGYVVWFQPRIVQNPMRAAALEGEVDRLLPDWLPRHGAARQSFGRFCAKAASCSGLAGAWFCACHSA